MAEVVDETTCGAAGVASDAGSGVTLAPGFAIAGGTADVGLAPESAADCAQADGMPSIRPKARTGEKRLMLW
jgi:hypothetical protein